MGFRFADLQIKAGSEGEYCYQIQYPQGRTQREGSVSPSNQEKSGLIQPSKD